MNKEMIREFVEDYYGLVISVRTRKQETIKARFMYYKLVRSNTKLSLDAIGKSLGYDHASVMHGVKQMNCWIATDRTFKNDYRVLQNKINNVNNIAEDIEEDTTALVLEYAKLKELVRELSFERDEILNEHKTLLEKHNKRERFYAKFGFI
jgi:DNA-binding transcriptional regulator GbsR (MarR family)